MPTRRWILLTVPLMLCAATAVAQQRTPSGAVSVAQVLAAVEHAPRDRAARDILTAYVSGLAEGLVAASDLATARGLGRLFCPGPVKADSAMITAVLTEAVPCRADRSRTAATPILVNHFARRSCR